MCDLHSYIVCCYFRLVLVTKLIYTHIFDSICQKPSSFLEEWGIKHVSVSCIYLIWYNHY
jgi:hypothetical protein